MPQNGSGEGAWWDLHVRIPVSWRPHIEAAANARSLSKADWIRQLIREVMIRRPREDE